MATASRNPVRRASGPAAPAAAAEYFPPADRAARGKSLRKATPRSSHSSWDPPRPDRPDPFALLEEQAAERVPDLVPIRYGRMAASPFAFYRGAAYVMASDLANSPQTGIRVRLSAMRTWPISARSPRRSGSCSSTSTTSTRPFPAHGNGT